MANLLKPALILVILLPLSANGIFLHMRHSEEKCFFEEIPYETLIMVKYKLDIWNPDKTKGVVLTTNASSDADVTGLGLKVTVKDPDGKVVLSKSYGREGRFAFTSHMPGDHIICLASNDTSLQDFLRVHLKIMIGGKAVDYDKVKHKEKLTGIHLQLRKLQDLTLQIRKEQDYQRTREKRFRQTSESTNARVFFFAVIQTFLLVGVSVCQVRHLKMFFLIKKLV